MAFERILDLGIGTGGSYITTHTQPDQRRIGIDLDTSKLSILKRNHPEVLQVLSSAEHLPFATNSFSQIETVLPLGTLAFPGLQRDHFALNAEYREEYAQTSPNGWYAEFGRILKPYGTLTIYADLWIEPHQVQKTCGGFFIVESVQPLTLEEFRSLDTQTTKRISNIYKDEYVKGLNKKWIQTLHRIMLKSTRSSYELAK